MKKLFALLMLVTSITINLCAQSNSKADNTFEVPANIIINRRFMVALDNGNKVKIEITDITDLERISNMDSILQVFMNDMADLKDSLANPLTSKRIDYITDANGRKKIRFQQFQPTGASFLIKDGELASLRTEQDTIHIIGILANPPAPQQKISLHNPRYYHLTFYLNDAAELSNYMHGTLQQKIATLQQNINGKWPLILGGGDHSLKADSTISAGAPKGFTPNGIGDYLNGYITVNMQNYKNYFVPSFSLGLKLVLTNRDRTYKWEPGILWEPHYLFAKDNTGKLKTYRNDFLTLTYGQGGTKDFNPRKDYSFNTVFSLGYLIRQQGDFMEKNTFRLGAGKLQWYKTTIEPSMYFDNFFHGVTPGIRISQYF